MAKATIRKVASVAAIGGSAALLATLAGFALGRQNAGSSSAPSVSPPSAILAPPPVTRVVLVAPPPPRQPPPRPAKPSLTAAAAPVLPGGGISVPARATETDAAHVVVLVSGAVARPGVYTLGRGARVADAIRAAGGATAPPGAPASADLPLNRPLRHADQVHVPATASQNKGVEPAGRPQRRVARVKPAPPLPAAPTDEDASTPDAVATPGGPSNDAANAAQAAPVPAPSTAAAPVVNLNTADAATLQKKLGIGPLLAARIIAYRREVGGFKSPEQLLDVSGMTEARFDALQARVRVD